MAEQVLCLEVVRLGHFITRGLDARTRPHGLTGAPLHALLTVAAHDGVALRTVADALGMAPATATEAVDQLVRRGWVEKTTNTADRRSVLARLTPLGRQKILAIRPVIERFENEIGSGLEPTDVALTAETIRHMLEKIAVKSQPMGKHRVANDP